METPPDAKFKHNSRCGNVQNTKCWCTVGGARVPQVPQPFFGAIPTLLAFEKMLQTETRLDWKGKTWKKMKNDLWIRNQKPYIAMNQRWNDFKWQLLHILSKNGAHLGKQNWSSRSSSFHVFLWSMYCFHQQIDRCCIGKTCEQSVRPETEFMPLVSDSV